MIEYRKTQNEGTLALKADDGRLVNVTLLIDYTVMVSKTGSIAKLPVGFAHRLDDGSEVERLDDDTFRITATGEVLRTGL